MRHTYRGTTYTPYIHVHGWSCSRSGSVCRSSTGRTSALTRRRVQCRCPHELLGRWLAVDIVDQPFISATGWMSAGLIPALPSSVNWHVHQKGEQEKGTRVSRRWEQFLNIHCRSDVAFLHHRHTVHLCTDLCTCTAS